MYPSTFILGVNPRPGDPLYLPIGFHFQQLGNSGRGAEKTIDFE